MFSGFSKFRMLLLLLTIAGWQLSAAPRLVRAVSIQGRYYETTNHDGADTIFIFKSLNDASFETVTGKYATWTDVVTKQSWDQSNVFQNLTDGHCYKAVVDDNKATYFVFIDYTKHQLDKIKIDRIELDCENTTFYYDKSLAMTYYTKDGVKRDLPYKIAVTYNNQQWDSTAVEWKEVEVVDTISINSSGQSTLGKNVNLIDTKFVFEESKIASVLNQDESSVTYTDDSTYTAVAVQHRMQYYIAKRGDVIKNEMEGPYGVGHLSSEAVHSAPINVLFESHPSAKADVYEWTIRRGTEIITHRNDKDIRYIFDEVSENSSSYYDVDLKLINSEHVSCFDTAHIQFELKNSYINVPNVFTPNGDGINDEFRVAYKSICEFHCWVYNRWQHLVYKWDDPTKGWDGTYNGKKVPDSAYVWIIEAVGCDGQKYKLKGTVNLLRGK